MRVKSALVLVVLTIALLAGVAFGDCNRYDNSKIVYYGGQAYCGGWGPGCTECTEGGGSCVTNGESCVPHIQNKSA